MTDKPTDKDLDRVRAVLASQDEVELPADLQPADGDDDDTAGDGDDEGDLGDDGDRGYEGDPGPAPDGLEYDPGDPGPAPGGDPGPAGEGSPDELDPVAIDDLRKGSEFPLNDYGNGQRFELYFGRDVIWVPRVGWYVWTGKVWAKDDDGLAVRRKAQAIGRRIEQEANSLTLGDEGMKALARERSVKTDLSTKRRSLSSAGDDEKEAIRIEVEKLELQLAAIESLKRLLSTKKARHRKFAVTSGNKGKLDALLNEAGVFLSKSLDELDAAEFDLNTESGLLRFERIAGGDGFSSMADVKLLPHAREHFITKLMPVKYDPTARSALFDGFVTRIQPASTMRQFLQRWFGYSLTGNTGEQKLVFAHGAGANGKSVLVDLVARIAGNYATTAKIESLVGKNRRSAGDATPELVPLMGARMVRASEPEEGERLQEAKIKELTGGEPLLVRALQEDFVEVKPKFKITIQGNHKPEVRGTDDGIWRRLLLVPFAVQIPEAERDRSLGAKLFDESNRSAVLNWIVEGLLDYLEGGLREPDEVLAATAAFREESDPVAAFLVECSVVTGDAHDFVKASDLREAFQFWQKAKGDGAWGDRTVANRMKQKAGVWRHPTSGAVFIEAKKTDWGYRGIKFTDTFKPLFEARPKFGGGSRSRDDDQDWRDRAGVPDND